MTLLLKEKADNTDSSTLGQVLVPVPVANFLHAAGVTSYYWYYYRLDM